MWLAGNRAFTAISFSGCGHMSGAVVAGVTLKDYGGGSAKTSQFGVRGSEQTWRLASQHARAELGLDNWSEARPGGCDVSGDEDDLGRKCGGDEAEPLAEMERLAVEGLEGCGIAILGVAEQFLRGDGAMFSGDFAVEADGGAGRGVHLPTAALAAAALGTAGVHGDMAELAGEATTAYDELSIGEHGGADAFADGDQDCAAGAVEAPGHTDADAFEGAIAMG